MSDSYVLPDDNDEDDIHVSEEDIIDETNEKDIDICY